MITPEPNPSEPAVELGYTTPAMPEAAALDPVYTPDAAAFSYELVADEGASPAAAETQPVASATSPDLTAAMPTEPGLAVAATPASPSAHPGTPLSRKDLPTPGAALEQYLYGGAPQ